MRPCEAAGNGFSSFDDFYDFSGFDDFKRFCRDDRFSFHDRQITLRDFFRFERNNVGGKTTRGRLERKHFLEGKIDERKPKLSEVESSQMDERMLALWSMRHR